MINYNKSHNITEDYGYAVNDCLTDKKVGDNVSEGSFLYKSDNYDDDGNYMYGRNLRAVYLPLYGRTYEDGVVISQSAADKFTSYKVENTTVSVNGNDILVNLYGDDKNYKAFPNVGDHVESGVLIASRRRDKRSIFYDLQQSKINEYDPTNDDLVYTGGGTITDIEIYSNMPLSELRKKTSVFNKEILEILENNNRYYTELAAALEKIIPCRELTNAEKNKERADYGCVIKHPIPREINPNKYTDELAYAWKVSHENIDERIKWRYDGKTFDNFKIKFTILKENPLMPGAKLTGRYGNKGIVSAILPDSEMPTTEDGVVAEICLNPLGIINRLNPSQIKEQYLNFMADHVVKLMKETDDYEKKQSLFEEFLKNINKQEYDYFSVELMMMNRQQKQDFLDRVEEEGIYIHEPPFFGNTSMEQFKKIFKEHPEWCTEYKFKGIEKSMTMGQIYFIRLKHEPQNKSSIRSAANLNVRNLPSKSTLKKEKKVQISHNPLRLGEMEIMNLLITKKPETVEKLMKTYATNQTLRENTISQLIEPGILPNGHKRNPLDMNITADIYNNPAISSEILEKYLNLLGLTLVHDKTDKQDSSENKSEDQTRKDDTSKE